MRAAQWSHILRDMESITAHDLLCPDGAPYPPQWENSRFLNLLSALNDIQQEWQGQLHIVSGYRTVSFNSAIGGLPRSLHIHGIAADIRPASCDEEVVSALHTLILNMWAQGKLPQVGGLGVYPRWVHVDARAHDANELVKWVGSGIGSEVPVGAEPSAPPRWRR